MKIPCKVINSEVGRIEGGCRYLRISYIGVGVIGLILLFIQSSLGCQLKYTHYPLLGVIDLDLGFWFTFPAKIIYFILNLLENKYIGWLEQEKGVQKNIKIIN